MSILFPPSHFTVWVSAEEPSLGGCCVGGQGWDFLILWCLLT